MPVKLDGMDNVKRALAACNDMAKGSALMRDLRAEMQRAVNEVQRVAVNKAPLATRALRDSAHNEVQFQGATIQAEVTFGGQASKYAERQHEEEGFRHKLPAGMDRNRTKRGKKRKHPIKGYRGGQAHFLHGPKSAWAAREKAVLRELDRAVGEIADRHISEASK